MNLRPSAAPLPLLEHRTRLIPRATDLSALVADLSDVLIYGRSRSGATLFEQPMRPTGHHKVRNIATRELLARGRQWTL